MVETSSRFDLFLLCIILKSEEAEYFPVYHGIKANFPISGGVQEQLQLNCELVLDSSQLSMLICR